MKRDTGAGYHGPRGPQEGQDDATKSFRIGFDEDGSGDLGCRESQGGNPTGWVVASFQQVMNMALVIAATELLEAKDHEDMLAELETRFPRITAAFRELTAAYEERG